MQTQMMTRSQFLAYVDTQLTKAAGELADQARSRLEALRKAVFDANAGFIGQGKPAMPVSTYKDPFMLPVGGEGGLPTVQSPASGDYFTERAPSLGVKPPSNERPLGSIPPSSKGGDPPFSNAQPTIKKDKPVDWPSDLNDEPLPQG